ncbi:MAG: DUF3868 domain-containing protein [Tannerellaceae bacterium]|jgi:hypothetical protein|nr:DUF3868 domain-containing protein [Tannerellaceae bacterium]
MRRALFLTTISIMLSCVAMHAQQRAGSVSAKINRVDLKGTALNLDLDMRIDHMQIGRYESLSLTLVLRGTGKGQTLSLPPVVVNGSNKRRMFDRAVALYGITEAKKGAYDVLKNDPDLTQYVGYRRAVAYKSWMNNCQLLLVGEIKDYHNNTKQRFTNVVEKRIAVRSSNATSNTVTMPPAANQTARPTNQPTRPANQTTQPAGTTTRPANQSTNRPAGTTTRPANQSANRPAGTTTTNRPPANNNRR